MSTHRHIDRICALVLVLTLVLTVLFMNGEALGLTASQGAMGYEKLFDTTKVHTLDIVIDDWEGFLDTCEEEEYAPCAAVIDGESFKNIGIRGKGNTSLSTVAQMGSDRYSFKLEFDCYDAGKSYHGLDKLCLNNLIQDNTMMKDYLTYQMMGQFGAAAPLCSYVWITVNGEDWGLYLAVEGIEDSFLRRNYGADAGELYKPDNMSFGGGRGNGKGFDMGDMDFGQMPAMPGGENGQMRAMPDGEGGQMPAQGERLDGAPGGGFGGGFGGGMGSDDVKLKYAGDDPDSYSNIFSSAKTDITDADRSRLIAALKALGEGDASAVDTQAVLRYFVVHNFVVNGDSYTGSMVHNYYLYEKDGRLSMLPWDYNLAFGTFQGSDASAAVNDPIDAPLSVSGDGDRPMADWIFQDETYTALYHQYFAEFLSSVDPSTIIESASALIAPYVEQDPTKFCTAEQFQTGVEALKTFCDLRAQSVSGQLDGTIPSTDQAQSEDRSALVDASAVSLSDMGTMGGGMGGGPDRAEGGPDEAAPDGTEQSSGAGEAGQGRSDGDAAPAFGPMGGGGGQRGPGDMGGGFPGGDAPTGDTPAGGTAGLILLGASVLVMALGLVFAFRFRRYGEK